MDNSLVRYTLKHLLIFCFWLVAARYLGGLALMVMTLVGVLCILREKFGCAYSIYAMMTFMIVINPFILPKTVLFMGVGLRFGALLLGLSLMVRGMKMSGKIRLPLGWLMLFLAVAAISSARGWAPFVSYMKMINFIVFFCSIWIGSPLLIKDEKGLEELRGTFIAIGAFVIVGSLALAPFPGISTLQAVKLAALQDAGESGFARNVLEKALMENDSMLLCGVLFHSQALGALLACVFAWIF